MVEKRTQRYLDALMRLSQTLSQTQREAFEKAIKGITDDVDALELARNEQSKAQAGAVVRAVMLVSELKEAREVAEQATRAKAAFLANMSHELRTPMNAVIGLASLLQDTPLAERQRDFVDTIVGSAEGLLVILNDILDFSKLEAGRLELEARACDVTDVAYDAAEVVALTAHAKGIEVLVDAPLNRPLRLLTDQGRIRQCLLNLLGNAAKFTSKGYVRLHITAEDRADGETEVRFEIHDTGIGIESDTLACLFQPFAQADASTSRQYGGTGLGLAISAHLARALGGEIGVESTPGKGSCFWFTVRARPAKEEPANLAKPESLKGVRALVLMELVAALDIGIRTLVSWGVEVTPCRDLAELEQTLDKMIQAGHAPEFIVTDRYVQNIDIQSGIERLRKQRPTSIPHVLFLSPLGSPALSASLSETGAAIEVPKPLRPRRLLSAMRATLGQTTTVYDAAKDVIQGVERAKLAGARVLLIEDNPVNTKVACLMMRGLGLNVTTAENGEVGIRTLSEMAPCDIILMDCQMPVLDGYEATRQIRARETELGGHVPIVAMTAHALQGDREKCLAAGMDDYMSKPIRPAEMEVMLVRWLVYRGGERQVG